MKKSVLTILSAGMLFLLFSISAKAQSGISIMDFVVLPVFNTDTTASQDSIDVMLYFKLNNIQNAAKADVYFETMQNATDVFHLSSNVVSESGKYYFNCMGNKIEVTNNSARLITKLSMQQIEAYKYISLVVQDTGGQQSNTLFVRK